MVERCSTHTLDPLYLLHILFIHIFSQSSQNSPPVLNLWFYNHTEPFTAGVTHACPHVPFNLESFSAGINNLYTWTAFMFSQEEKLRYFLLLDRGSPWGPGHAEPSPPRQAVAAQRPGSTGLPHFWRKTKPTISFAGQSNPAVRLGAATEPNMRTLTARS